MGLVGLVRAGLPLLGVAACACVFDPTLGHRPEDGGPDTGPSDIHVEPVDGGFDAGPFNDADPADLGPLDRGADAEADAGFEHPSARPRSLLIPANTSTVVQLGGTDPQGRPLTFVLDTQGLRGSASLVGDRVTYDAPPDFDGRDAFTYRSSNGVLGSDPVQVELRIYDNRTCGQILATSTAAVDGLYRLDPDGAGGDPAFEAYCEMDLGGGGWMLAGRSVAGGVATQFGWRDAIGSAAVDASPYSLGALERGVDFDEIMAATYTTGKIIDEAYGLEYSNDFEDSCDDAACALDAWRPYSGACATSLSFSPTMLSYSGRNRSRDYFFFRDSTGDFPTGLLPGGWDTFYNLCSLGAGLNGNQGMIFIRCRGRNCEPQNW